jgi:hypothetical protein
MRKIKSFFKELADTTSFIFSLLFYIFIMSIAKLIDKIKLAFIKKKYGNNSWEFADAKNKANIDPWE